ncbi:MAG: hypothetical protein L3K15_03010 [Thermoplasmata archaeon]|nr:hypothetical protein [Thermoplasmata archaeon]
MVADFAAFAVEDAMLSWDIHVRGCRSCLRAGNNLCNEGESLADGVLGARGQLELQERGSEDAVAGRSRPRPLTFLQRTLLPFGGRA